MPHVIPATRARIVHALLATLTIVAGLLVHRGVVPLGDTVRDVAGDALWAMMITWGVGVLWPVRRLAWRGMVAQLVCTVVECSQLVHTPALDALRRTLPGRLVLGSDFDRRDLLAYALGVAAAVAMEQVARVVLSRRRHGH